jgi:hypothetical protein
VTRVNDGTVREKRRGDDPQLNRDRWKERERECVCVCVCVIERTEREKEREREIAQMLLSFFSLSLSLLPFDFLFLFIAFRIQKESHKLSMIEERGEKRRREEGGSHLSEVLFWSRPAS